MPSASLKAVQAVFNRPFKAFMGIFGPAFVRLLADEHRCTLPGSGKTWPATYYQCPECGRRWERCGHLRAPWSHISVGSRSIDVRKPLG